VHFPAQDDCCAPTNFEVACWDAARLRLRERESSTGARAVHFMLGCVSRPAIVPRPWWQAGGSWPARATHLERPGTNGLARVADNAPAAAAAASSHIEVHLIDCACCCFCCCRPTQPPESCAPPPACMRIFLTQKRARGQFLPRKYDAVIFSCSAPCFFFARNEKCKVESVEEFCSRWAAMLNSDQVRVGGRRKRSRMRDDFKRPRCNFVAAVAARHPHPANQQGDVDFDLDSIRLRLSDVPLALAFHSACGGVASSEISSWELKLS